jgi:hypothetical protein
VEGVEFSFVSGIGRPESRCCAFWATLCSHGLLACRFLICFEFFGANLTVIIPETTLHTGMGMAAGRSGAGTTFTCAKVCPRARSPVCPRPKITAYACARRISAGTRATRHPQKNSFPVRRGADAAPACCPLVPLCCEPLVGSHRRRQGAARRRASVQPRGGESPHR